MGNAVIGWQKGWRKDFACVHASEVARFGDRMEYLSKGVLMNRKIVDGFVRGWAVTVVRSGWDHREDSTGVGHREAFTLRYDELVW